MKLPILFIVLLVHRGICVEREDSDTGDIIPKPKSAGAEFKPDNVDSASTTGSSIPEPAVAHSDEQGSEPSIEDEGPEFVTTGPTEMPTGGRTRCSELICDVKCRINNCPLSECLENGRCRCYCPRAVDPVQAFFSSILTSHMEPGLRLHFGQPAFQRPSFPTFPRFPDFPRFPVPMKDIIEKASETPFAMHTKIYSTVSQTCGKSEDCSEACHGCNVTNCVYGLCQCTSCERTQQTNLQSRTSNVLKTCQSARNCAEHCTNCSSVMCRYGACECNMCKKEEAITTTEAALDVTSAETSTTEATENRGGVTSSTEAAVTDLDDGLSTTEGASTPSARSGDVTTEAALGSETDIISIAHNATDPTEAVTGPHKTECVPKKCNHSCWERQCRKFKCVNNRCTCEQCPKEVFAVVGQSTNGEASVESDAEQLEKNRYQVVF